MKSRSSNMPLAMVIILVAGIIYILPFGKETGKLPAESVTPAITPPEGFPREISMRGLVEKNDLHQRTIKLAGPGGNYIVSYGEGGRCLNTNVSEKGKKIKTGQTIEVYGITDGSTIKTCTEKKFYITTEYCGDGICQNTVCTVLGCPRPETSDTCPADCYKPPDRTYKIEDLKKNIGKGGEYKVAGYVVKTHSCPPCDESGQCKPCAEPHVVIMDTDELLLTYRPNPDNLLIYTDNPHVFKVGSRYLFTVFVSGTYSTGDSIPDIILKKYGKAGD